MFAFVGIFSANSEIIWKLMISGAVIVLLDVRDLCILFYFSVKLCFKSATEIQFNNLTTSFYITLAYCEKHRYFVITGLHVSVFHCKLQ